MKLITITTLASLIATAAGSELCQTSNEYDSTAAVGQYCYIDTYSDLASAETACEVSDRYCAAFEISGTFYCWCSTYDLTVDCPLTSPTFGEQQSCGDEADLWDYSDSDAETMCSDSPGDMAQYAYNCCGGGYAICEDYTSQLCSSKDDYAPTTDYSNWCFAINQDEDDSVASSACSTLGCNWGSGDLTGDGVVDDYCFCYDFDASTGCPLSDYDIVGYNNCAESWEDWDYDSEYSSVIAACHENYENYADAAETCCTSQESVCAGYCYSADSTAAVMYGETVAEVPISELKKGDKIMSFQADKNAKSYSTVTYIASAKSDGEFYEINMKNRELGSTEKLRATPHHTFPSCADTNKLLKAAYIKEGDCLVTEQGKQHVASVSKQASVEGDYTYSLQVEDSDIVFIGGVATHSQSVRTPSAMATANKHAKSAWTNLKLRGSAPNELKEKKYFTEDKHYAAKKKHADKQVKAHSKIDKPHQKMKAQKIITAKYVK